MQVVTWHQVRVRNHKTDYTLNTRLNEGNWDTPEPNEHNQRREKLGHGEHMGTENTTKQVQGCDNIIIIIIIIIVFLMKCIYLNK